MPHRCLRTGPTTPHHQVSRPPGLYLVFPLNYPCHIYNLIYTFIALFFFPTLPNQGRFYKRAWCYRTLIFACLESRRNSGKHALVPSQICKYLPSCNVCLPVIIIYYREFFLQKQTPAVTQTKSQLMFAAIEGWRSTVFLYSPMADLVSFKINHLC